MLAQRATRYNLRAALYNPSMTQEPLEESEFDPLDDPEGPSEHDLAAEADPFIPCPACRSDVYDELSICPQCGQDLLAEVPHRGSWWWTTLVAAGITAVIVILAF